MKAKCKKQFIQLAGILDKDDVVELTPILSKEDKHVIYNQRVKTDTGYKIVPNVTIIPKGNYEGVTFVAKNGKTYDDQCLINHIGYTPLSEIFTLID